jgi:hypothetical protein
MIGLDIDSKNVFNLLKVYFNSASIARVEVSSTRQGFHLRIRKRVGTAKQLQIRANLGDCKGRLEFDEMKLRTGLFELVDTLFEYKKSPTKSRGFRSAQSGKDGVWTKEEPVENVLAAPFWEPRVALKRSRWKKFERKHNGSAEVIKR